MNELRGPRLGPTAYPPRESRADIRVDPLRSDERSPRKVKGFHAGGTVQARSQKRAQRPQALS
jgi:hypothetical protein